MMSWYLAMTFSLSTWVFDALDKANLKINSDECAFFADKLTLRGHIKFLNGKKVETIVKREPPKNTKDC